MRFAIAAHDAGDHVAIDGVALVRPVDGDPEGQSALFEYHAIGIGHGRTHPFAKCQPAFAAGRPWTASAI
jgi:hypothetical protein